MQKFFNLLAVLLTILVLSASSAYAGNRNGNNSGRWHQHGHDSHNWSSWFSGWGPGNGWGWGHFKSHGNKGNNGSNGCERSNPRSSACEQNPNTVIFCSPWTDFEVQHPISWEIAINPAGWVVGDTAEFASGATCEINQVSIGGRNDTPTPPPGRG